MDTCFRLNQSTVFLNVRGIRYEVMLENFLKYPHTRLGLLRSQIVIQNREKISDLCFKCSTDLKEFYFDRDPFVLNKILNLYQTGQLHINTSAECASFINDELKYWMIDPSLLSNCCQISFSEKLEETEDLEKSLQKITKNLNRKKKFSKGATPAWKEKLWLIFDKPKSSKLAKVVFILSILMITISIFDMVIQTVPELKPFIIDHFSLETSMPFNFALDFTQLLCIIWSIIEISLRIISCPDKCLFFKSPLNIIDILSIVPYLLWLCLPDLQQLSVVRVLSLFKVSRYCSGLKMFGKTIYKSLKELFILVLLFFIAIILFSTIIFYCENDQNSGEFYSIPSTFWYTMITLTTVGYGDVSPRSTLGKIFGSICAFCGLIIIALPISIIASNFAKIAEEEKREDRYTRLQKKHPFLIE